MNETLSAADLAKPVDPRLPPTRARLFGDCFMLGLTAWGGFMALLAQAQEQFVKRRQWLSEKDFLDLIALVTMLPGPQAVNAIAVVGHRVAGWGGFAAALVGLVLPGFCVILALWFGYGALAAYPASLHAVSVGVLPPLAMILGLAAFNQSRKATPGRKEKALAAAAAVLLLAVPFWAAPVCALAFGAVVALLAWPAPRLAEAPGARPLRPLQLAMCVAPACLAVFQLVPSLLPEALLARIGLAFAGLSTTIFGGALVMVPLLDGLIVERLGWLDAAGFRMGLAASQLTPGPVLGIATFAGMQAAGWGGAVAATIGIYLPTAIIAVGVDAVAERFKSARRFQHAMLGIRCAVVGLIAGAAVSLLLALPLGAMPWRSAVLVAAAWLVVWRWKQPPYVSLPLSALLAWGLLALRP